MLVKTGAVDYRFAIAFVVWFIATAWIADDIVTAFRDLVITLIRTTSAASPLIGF